MVLMGISLLKLELGLSVHGSATGICSDTLSGAGGTFIHWWRLSTLVETFIHLMIDVSLRYQPEVSWVSQQIGTLEVTGISSIGLGVTDAGYGVTTTQLSVSGCCFRYRE